MTMAAVVTVKRRSEASRTLPCTRAADAAEYRQRQLWGRCLRQKHDGGNNGRWHTTKNHAANAIEGEEGHQSSLAFHDTLGMSSLPVGDME